MIYMKEIMQHLYELQTLEFDESVQPGSEKRVEALRKKIPAPILAHYDRLADQGKKGLAVVRNQTCSGCHMRLPLAVIMELRHATDVCLCDNCRRYLYLLDETPVAAAKPTTVKASVKAGKRARPEMVLGTVL